METKEINAWWGYSQEYGWVVLDRTIEENQPGSPSQLLFVKCSDWSVYEENRENWGKPKYTFEDTFISKLSVAERKLTLEELDRLKIDYQRRKRSIYFQHSQSKRANPQETIRKHKAFLELFDEKPGSYKAKMRTDRNRRITHCWSCKTHLDNVPGLECSKCGWIVCESCGACGCGYNK